MAHLWLTQSPLRTVRLSIGNWRQNLFTIPYGQEGKAFITELTRLLRAFVDKSGLEGIALKASMVLPALVLQRPHSTSRAKDHVRCLSRRLRAWRLGLIDELVREGRTSQKCLQKRSSVDRDGDHFTTLIFELGVSWKDLRSHASFVRV